MQNKIKKISLEFILSSFYKDCFKVYATFRLSCCDSASKAVSLRNIIVLPKSTLRSFDDVNIPALVINLSKQTKMLFSFFAATKRKNKLKKV